MKFLHAWSTLWGFLNCRAWEPGTRCVNYSLYLLGSSHSLVSSLLAGCERFLGGLLGALSGRRGSAGHSFLDLAPDTLLLVRLPVCRLLQLTLQVLQTTLGILCGFCSPVPRINLVAYLSHASEKQIRERSTYSLSVRSLHLVHLS